MCDAGQWATVEAAEARQVKRVEAAERAEVERQRGEAMRRYAEDCQALRAAKVAGWREDAADHGVCFTCLYRTDGRRRVRHRRLDFHQPSLGVRS